MVGLCHDGKSLTLNKIHKYVKGNVVIGKGTDPGDRQNIKILTFSLESHTQFTVRSWKS